MEVQTLIEQLLFVTVRITTTTSDGRTGSGTGFILAEEVSERGSLPFVVTNKHVVEGADKVKMHFLKRSGEGPGPALGEEHIVESSVANFIGHPDPEIDVAILPVGDVFQRLHDADTPLFFRQVSMSMCATSDALKDFEPIEPVTFIGYPNGLYDSTSLLPIVRQGHAATALNIDYEGKPLFLIDASVFPGSSGSPVFLVPKPSAPDKYGNITVGGPRRPPLLLGIVAAVHQRQVPVLQTNVGTGISYVQDLIDLGIVYKASAIRMFVSDVVDKWVEANL